MIKPAFLLAAPSSNTGKTTLTLALLRILAQKGMDVQPFKCGPDYLDTYLHTLASRFDGRGRQGRNLDIFMASEDHVKGVFLQHCAEADAAVVEGVMGLFDGSVKSEGSSAAIAGMLGIPVVLIVDAKGVAYSVAPLLYGFKHFDPSLRLAGVIFNRVNRLSHYEFLKEACHDVGVEPLGYVPRDETMAVSDRYLGLNIAPDVDQESAIAAMADHVSKTVDVEKIVQLCSVEIPRPFPRSSCTGRGNAVIAVARDAAFNFVYAENLDILGQYGKLEFFSPLDDAILPHADMLYLSGGYPELYAKRLAENAGMRKQVKAFALRGGVTYAECGGMMYLGNSITGRDGVNHEMCGALDLETTMRDAHLHLGYRKVDLSAAGYARELKGHEFHYSSLGGIGHLDNVAEIKTARGRVVDTAVFRVRNTFASYVHLYWGETPDFPGFLLDQAHVTGSSPENARD